MGARAAAARMPSVPLALAAGLAWAAPAGGAGEGETCAADGRGCVELPAFPDCEHSCGRRRCLASGSGNTERVWPACPSGPDGCRDCADKNQDCPRFARSFRGHGCEDNPSFMIDVCARSCNTCHLRNLTTRCGHLLDMPESVEPGAINRTVQRMLNIRGLSVEILSEDPWILKFPKFLTEEEIAFLTDAKTRGPWNTGQTEEYGRRKEVYTGFRKTDVAWCNCPCQDHPVGRMLVSRVSEVLQVHPHYLEKMQFLRYTPGMFFKPHHDAYLVGSPNDPRNTRKHRVYTFFMYLTDVARGGATHFPSLGLKVQPERGAAILWPSVYDHDPWKADPRTEHEGLAVEEGEKLSLNMWWRLGPNALAQDVGCPDWR